MNRSDVIKLIVKELGIHETDSKEFMEILLAKISSKITKGDKLVIDNIGSFEYSETDTKTFGLGAAEADKINFTPAWNLGLGSQAVQFEIPSLIYDSYSEIDAFFSLSIDKPVIRLTNGKEESSFDYPQTFDKKNSFEQKVNLLIASANFIQNDYFKTEKLIDKFDTDGSKNFNSKFDHSEFEEVRASKIDELGLKLQWKKELDEESILDIDLTNEKLEVIETKEDISNGWDIGQLTPHREAELKDENASEDFERVTSTTQELSVDLSELSSEISSGETHSEKVEEHVEEATDSFFDFDSLLRESLVDSVLNAEPIEQIIPEQEEKKDEDGLKIDDKYLEYKERSDKISKLPRFLDVRRWKKTEQYEDPFADDGEAGPRVVQKRSKLWYVFSFLIALCMFSFVYWRLYGIPSWVMDTKTKVERIIPKKIIPRIIERDYRIPLSYPYDKRNLASTSLIPKLGAQREVAATKADTSKLKALASSVDDKAAKNVKKEEKKKIPPVVKKENPVVEKKNQTDGNKQSEKKSTTPVIKKDNSKNVKDNIFMENGKYVVQISSWKNKTIAEREVARYLKKGFQAFLTSADLPGRGTWYRVRVGYFNTLEEAESSASKIF